MKVKLQCNYFFAKVFRFCVIKFVYLIIQVLGFLISRSKDDFRRIFIYLNNLPVLCHKLPEDRQPNVLVLLPHCLQFDECVFKITNNIDNCKQCGKCGIKDFVELKKRKNIVISVATGGTLARKTIIENNPDLIIACACERDLSAGIFDAYPFVVYGILNERPNGPCVNTTVDIRKIERFLDRVL